MMLSLCAGLTVIGGIWVYFYTRLWEQEKTVRSLLEAEMSEGDINKFLVAFSVKGYAVFPREKRPTV